jgi:hypothetical protein
VNQSSEALRCFNPSDHVADDPADFPDQTRTVTPPCTAKALYLVDYITGGTLTVKTISQIRTSQILFVLFLRIAEPFLPLD